jgi:hypothetical protein
MKKMKRIAAGAATLAMIASMALAMPMTASAEATKYSGIITGSSAKDSALTESVTYKNASNADKTITSYNAAELKKILVIKDDANEITEKILEAEVVVWSTPIYYYEMSGQMKTMIDRANSLYPRDYKFREIYLLSVAAEDEDYVDKNAAGGVQGWVDCFEKAEFKGKVFAGGVNEQGEIEGHKALNEAYSIGNAI